MTGYLILFSVATASLLLVTAGIHHLVRPQDLVVVRQAQIAAGIVSWFPASAPTTRVVGLVELALGGSLAFTATSVFDGGSRTPWVDIALLAILGLSLLYVRTTLAARRRGANAGCGCFGATDADEASPSTFAGLALAATTLACMGLVRIGEPTAFSASWLIALPQSGVLVAWVIARVRAEAPPLEPTWST